MSAIDTKHVLFPESLFGELLGFQMGHCVGWLIFSWLFSVSKAFSQPAEISLEDMGTDRIHEKGELEYMLYLRAKEGISPEQYMLSLWSSAIRIFQGNTLRSDINYLQTWHNATGLTIRYTETTKGGVMAVVFREDTNVGI